MKVTSRWERTAPPKDRDLGVYKVKTQGFVPIGKRIELMIKAGLTLQHKPTLYQFADGVVPEKFKPLEGVSKDLYFTERTKQEVIKNASETALKLQQEQSIMARQALETEIINNYIKTHPALVAGTPDASVGQTNS